MRKFRWQYESLTSLKGESWVSLPGLDGYYRISNYGRIRREPYDIIYKDGRSFTLGEKIIKPGTVAVHNQLKKDVQRYMVNRVTVNGTRYNLSVARLVYHCFVQAIDLVDLTQVVLFKDTDPFHIEPSNLYLATLRQKQARMISRKRFASPFGSLTKSQHQKRVSHLRDKKCKPVSQLTREGSLLQTYTCLKEAADHTGIGYVSISLAARGKLMTAGRYRWKWANLLPG
jgi:NUMOD4 motif